MSRQRASSPSPEIPVTQNDYKELLRHLNTQGHIVVLNLEVPDRPTKTWGQFFKRTNVREDVLYKEDIPGLMVELDNAIKNRTMISDSSSEKLKSINTMLHEKNPRWNIADERMYQPSATSATTSARPDEFGFGIYAQQQKQKQQAQEDADAIAADLAWKAQRPNWRADAESNAKSLAAEDEAALLDEYRNYQSTGGGFLGVLPLDLLIKMRNRERLPNMTVPSDVGKSNSAKENFRLFGPLELGRMDDPRGANRMGGKSKRILKSKSRSNKGKKTHRSRSTRRRSTCRR